MFITKSLVLICYYVVVVSLSLNIVVCMSEQNPSSNSTGFSVDIFHRYSPESPYHDPSLSPTQIIADAIGRSMKHSRWLNQTYSTRGSGSVETDIEPSFRGGLYFMRYKIGSVKVNSLGALDTGSSLLWTQCFPCTNCFKQSPPHYVTTVSSTYKHVPCNDTGCDITTIRYTLCKLQTCHYLVLYADDTFSEGELSRDSLTLASIGGTTTQFPNFIFGCSRNSSINHGFHGFESGIVGLGRGPHSLVSQLGSLARGKFSYCLVHLTESGKKSTRLLFGDNSEVRGEVVVRTPLFVIKNDPEAYYVKLFGFSVGESKYIERTYVGNFVIDSGATLTRLPNVMYYKLKEYVKKEMMNYKIKPDPLGSLDLCYLSIGGFPRVPTLTFHFKSETRYGFADLTFAHNNMFVNVYGHIYCLMVLPAGKEEATLGYLAQANFFVEYDTEMKRMSFERTDCTKLAY